MPTPPLLSPAADHRAERRTRPTIGQIVWQTLDLAGGLGIVLLLLLTALPA